MINTKLLNLLSICRKSGRMTFGFDTVKRSINDGKSEAIILVSDISEKTAKEVRFFADKKNIPVYDAKFTMGEFEFSVGKKTAVISVNDKGFADKISELFGGN